MSANTPHPVHVVSRPWNRGEVVRIRINAPIAVPPHGHAHQHLCVVTRGAFNEQWQPTAHCARGALRLSPANDQHSLEILDAPFECVVIGIAGRASADAPSTRTYGSSDEVQLLADKLVAKMDSADPLSRLSVLSLSAELVATSVRVASTRDLRNAPTWLSEVRRALDSDFVRPAGARQLSRWAGVHPVHISRAFRAHYGRTMREYVRERRLAAAIAALGENQLSISEVAAECGFSDHAHLTRAMRQSIGRTPSSLRNCYQR